MQELHNGLVSIYGEALENHLVTIHCQQQSFNIHRPHTSSLHIANCELPLHELWLNYTNHDVDAVPGAVLIIVHATVNNNAAILNIASVEALKVLSLLLYLTRLFWLDLVSFWRYANIDAYM